MRPKGTSVVSSKIERRHHGIHPPDRTHPRLPVLRCPQGRYCVGPARRYRHCHPGVCLQSGPGQAAGRRDADHSRRGGRLRYAAGLGRTRRAAATGREDTAAQSEICIHPGAIHDLHPDHAVRHRACGVYDAADHLRRSHQEQHSPRAADGGFFHRQPDGHHGQPGVGRHRLAGGLPRQGTRR